MLHRNMVLDDIHSIHAWEVADAAARTALAVTAPDIGKIAKQTDGTVSYWILCNNVGPVWKDITVASFTNADILAAVLTGLSLADATDVVAANSILVAFGKLQAQMDVAYAAIAVIPKVIPVACSDETTALTVGTNKVVFRMPYGVFPLAIRASLTTAQTSGTIFTVDFLVNGASILTTLLTIDNTEKTSTTAAVPVVFNPGLIVDDAEISISITQIGDGTAKGLKVYLIGR